MAYRGPRSSVERTVCCLQGSALVNATVGLQTHPLFNIDVEVIVVDCSFGRNTVCNRFIKTPLRRVGPVNFLLLDAGTTVLSNLGGFEEVRKPSVTVTDWSFKWLYHDSSKVIARVITRANWTNVGRQSVGGGI